MPGTPPQWGSAPTHTSNVNIVRHVKATVGIQKPEEQPCPFGTRRRTPRTALGCSPAGVAVAPVLLSVCVFYVRSLQIATKLRHRHSKMLQPHPDQHSARSPFTLAGWAEPAAAHSCSWFGVHGTVEPRAVCSSLAMTREATGRLSRGRAASNQPGSHQEAEPLFQNKRLFAKRCFNSTDY